MGALNPADEVDPLSQLITLNIGDSISIAELAPSANNNSAGGPISAIDILSPIFQAKRYAPGSVVGRPEVQGFVGSLVGLGATKGVFVTTSTFSSHATEFVRHLTQRVVLIDGRQLSDLMIEHGVGVRVSRALEFKRLDEDFFAEEG